MNKISKCHICLKQFTQLDRSPITLEFGDVLCLKCITSYQTANNFIFPIKEKRLPITKGLLKFKAFLRNLPKSSTKSTEQAQPQTSAQTQSNSNADLFFCKVHPNNSIQYYCETENSAICSVCNSNHLRSKHSINKFTPKSKLNTLTDIGTVLISEVKGITKSIEEEIKCVNRLSSSLNSIKDNLTTHLNEQLKILRAATEKLMQNILRQKLTIQLQLNNYYNRQIKEVDSLIKSNSQIEAGLSKFKMQCKEYMAKLFNGEEKMIYNDYDEHKKAMITECEHTRISFRNIKIVSSKIRNEKKKGVRIIPMYSQTIFELVNQEATLLSQVVIISKAHIPRRSESIGSVKITTDSTKEELISDNKRRNDKGKGISNPNVHRNIFKIMPQLRQSQSQRVIS